MGTIDRAKQVLRDTESALRDLISEGLDRQRYADVAEIAKMADGVARLLNQHSPNSSSAPTATSSAGTQAQKASTPSSKSARKQAQAAGTKKTGYPRFERDGDRLVKVGWSKKNKEAYEHRAPRQAVTAFVRHLASQVESGHVFAVEDLLPVPDVTSGNEVPAYQVYMTLAWLRETDAIEKKGRDGYILRMADLADDGIDKLWDQLPQRST